MSAVDAVPWDYAALAPHYELRADYCADTVCDLLDACGVARLAPAADIGAGTGRLTRLLLARGHRVEAVEPCAPMRAIGIGLTRGAVRWHAADGAATATTAASARGPEALRAWRGGVPGGSRRGSASPAPAPPAGPWVG